VTSPCRVIAVALRARPIGPRGAVVRLGAQPAEPVVGEGLRHPAQRDGRQPLVVPRQTTVTYAGACASGIGAGMAAVAPRRSMTGALSCRAARLASLSRAWQVRNQRRWHTLLLER